VKELLGTVCLLQVEHGTSRKGNFFAKVANLMQAPEGVKVPPPVSEPFYFSLDPREFDQLAFDALPQWIVKKSKARTVGRPAQLCPACRSLARPHNRPGSGKPQCAQPFIHARNSGSAKFARGMSLGPFGSLCVRGEILLRIGSGPRSFSTWRGLARDAYEIACR
jgi:hypothetical protein